MAIKRKNNENEQNQSKPWKNIAYFDNFCEADKKRLKLLSENDKIQVKVKRCGINGAKFVIKLRKSALSEEKIDRKGKKSRKKSKNKKDRT